MVEALAAGNPQNSRALYGGQMMSFKEEWRQATQYTIEPLAAQGQPVCLLHNQSRYVGFMAPAPRRKGEAVWYKATVPDSGVPPSFWGSEGVTPLTLERVTHLS